ncbi:MAG: hypothetical protein JWM95_2371 [Gemmatimonadetes bacterium]|nr:hypothetical protein [Gemmatimonadota bacterium]
MRLYLLPAERDRSVRIPGPQVLMRRSIPVALLLLLASAAPRVSAQPGTGQVSTAIYENFQNDPWCQGGGVTDPGQASISSRCETVNQGLWAQSSYDLLTRSVSATTNFDGDGGSGAAGQFSIFGTGLASRQLTVLGTPGIGDYLRFRFATSVTFYGSDYSSTSSYSLGLVTNGNLSSAGESGDGMFSDGNVTRTLTGYDFISGLPGSPQLYRFLATSAEQLSFTYPGLHSELNASLSGIDVLDANGHYVRSATLGDDGYDIVDYTTPEPSSLSLLAFGILIIGAKTRRARRS